MSQASVLWVDDEIEILEAHRRFLEMKGYTVKTFTNGYDAVDHLAHVHVDIVLLDESMPGMSGLETISRIKQVHPHLPIVLITKNETESLMEEAIGSQIADYLIKPVNPNQVLLSLKKILDNKRLVAEHTASSYQRQFRTMLDAVNNNTGHQQWVHLYQKLIYWELEMEKSESPAWAEVHRSQVREANADFFKFVSRHYAAWVSNADLDPPLLSPMLFRNKVLPHVKKDGPVVWVVVDNLRLDQWKAIEPMLNVFYRIKEEECFFSILPTATQYCRNAIFYGGMPLEIEQDFPAYWQRDDDEEGKNMHEAFLFNEQLKRLNREDIDVDYKKISSYTEAVKMADHALNLLDHDLSILVYNFVDMMSHARTEMDLLRELASDESAYRSLTRSWFMHSPLFQALKKIAERSCTVILCTDHGSTLVKNPIRVTADKQTTNNLRYKNGRDLAYDHREVLVYKEPHRVGLPRQSVSASFIFAGQQDYFCYPHHFNQYASRYKNSFQHGGLSMEEMIVPVVRMTSKAAEN
jgi:CheY-like chemotaxis protein